MINTILLILATLASTLFFQPTPKSDIEQLVNDVRITAGITTLQSNDKLRASACNKAQDMIDRDYWSHNDPDGVEPWGMFKDAGYDYSSAGENLASGFDSPDATVKGWINSPAHYENLIGNFNEQGICSIAGEFQGRNQTVTVQHLGTRQLNN